jgi:hypothetical protein
MSISIDQLLQLASDRSRRKREALLRVVTEMFFAAAQRSEAEMSLFDDIMEMILADVEPLARRALAERMAERAAVPRETLLRLADDEIDVAEPVLVRSPALGDDDLVALAQYQTQLHLAAIARRASLSERLTDILVVRGNDNVAGAVAANAGARLSNAGFSTLVQRAAANDNVLDRLIMRCDLPEQIATALLPVLAASMHAKIERLDAVIADDAASELLGDAWAMLTERLRASAKSTRPFQVLVKLIERGALLFGEAVLELADADHLVDVAALIGRRLRLPSEIVVRNLFALDVQPAMLICRAAGLDLNGFSAVLRLRNRRKRRSDPPPADALRDYVTSPTTSLRRWSPRCASATSPRAMPDNGKSRLVERMLASPACVAS